MKINLNLRMSSVVRCSVLISALAYSSINANQLYANIVWLLILGNIVLNDDETNLYFLTGLSIFEYAIQFMSSIMIFPLFIVASIKLLYKKKGQLSRDCFCPLAILLVLELINDFFRVPILNMANLISIILYVAILIDMLPNLNIRIDEFSLIYYIAYFIAIISTITTYGSFSTFVYVLRQVDYTRFGGTTRYLTGGAMGIPLYSLIVLSIELTQITKIFHANNLFRKIISILIMIVTLSIGVFSQSRIFIICIVAIMIWLGLFSFKTRGKSFVPFILLCFMIIIMVFTQGSLIDEFLARINGRFETVFLMDGTSRLDIYLSCLNYLKRNPLRLMFGTGNLYYSILGTAIQQAFSKTAHNLILDGIMGYGIVGFSCIILLYTSLSKKLGSKYRYNEERFLNSMPLFVLFIHSLTADTFSVCKTWLLLIMLICYKYIPVGGSYDS